MLTRSRIMLASYSGRMSGTRPEYWFSCPLLELLVLLLPFLFAWPWRSAPLLYGCGS